MGSAWKQAVSLILSADSELCNILLVTAKMSFASSVLALLLGVPLGIWLGAVRFRGRGALLIVNRTLMGLPPVVCGLLFYLLFSGVGPFRQLKLLFTVELMILAQIALITPIVVGTMEPYVSGIAQSSMSGFGTHSITWISAILTFFLMFKIFDMTRKQLMEYVGKDADALYNKTMSDIGAVQDRMKSVKKIKGFFTKK